MSYTCTGNREKLWAAFRLQFAAQVISVLITCHADNLEQRDTLAEYVVTRCKTFRHICCMYKGVHRLVKYSS